jgi:hypothetical protein
MTRTLTLLLHVFAGITALYPCSADLHRQVWVGSLTGDPVWQEGDPYPASNDSVNRFLMYTEASYKVMLHAGGYLPDWHPTMFGVVDSESADLEGTAGPCTYGDTYFTSDTSGNFGSVFCPDMTTPFWIGHEWGHGYARQSGSLLGNDDATTGAIFEFLADVLGMAVQFLVLEQRGPSLDVIPYNKFRSGCSVYGENPGFGYIQGVAGVDESKRWLVGTECTTSPACPSRDMWDPTCFGAPDRTTSPNYLCFDAESEPNGKATRIHKNNGVGNRFFSLLVDGGSGVESIGLRKAARIVMDAIVKNSNEPPIPQGFDYPDLAAALEQACTDAKGAPLYDLWTGAPLDEVIRSIDCDEVSAAIAAVEMYTDPCPNDPAPVPPIVDTVQENEAASAGKGVRGSKHM